MPQKFAFTTAAMAAALEETPISYEDLADIERDFDDAETEISESTLPFGPVERARGIISDRSSFNSRVTKITLRTLPIAFATGIRQANR